MSAHISPISARELNRATLARQMLLARSDVDAVRAIERLAGVQAQQARPPFVGLWTRLQGFRCDDLLQALHRREIVRATAMRATLHLLSTRDYCGLRGALQPSLTRGLQGVTQGRGKAFDLDGLVAAGRAFFDGAGTNFDELRAHLKRKYPRRDERELAYAIRLHLPLVQVPTSARWGFPASADFACADAWLGKSISTQATPAHELVRRYLAAFGPATPADAQTWSGLSGLRAVFDALRPELVVFRDADGRELFDLPDAPRPPADAPAPVRFLPDFDNLVLAYQDRRRLLADEHRPRLVTKNLLVRATFLVDGRVAGTWKAERKKEMATLLMEPFGRLTKKARAELEREGDALLRFVEEDARTRAVRWAD